MFFDSSFKLTLGLTDVYKAVIERYLIHSIFPDRVFESAEMRFKGVESIISKLKFEGSGDSTKL